MSFYDFLCPECGCCCDYGKPCCAQCQDGNTDHLGERGGCKRLDPGFVPTEYQTGPHRPCGHFACTGIFCTDQYRRQVICCPGNYVIAKKKKPAGVTSTDEPAKG